MRYCSNCEFNDGFIYTSMPPMYKCTITNQYHFGNFGCNLEWAPIVRCKDCKWHYIFNGHIRCDLDTEAYNFKPDFYCANGERREDETD